MPEPITISSLNIVHFHPWQAYSRGLPYNVPDDRFYEHTRRAFFVENFSKLCLLDLTLVGQSLKHDMLNGCELDPWLQRLLDQCFCCYGVQYYTAVARPCQPVSGVNLFHN